MSVVCLSRLLLSAALVATPCLSDARTPEIRVGLLASGPTMDAAADWDPWVAEMSATVGGGGRIRLVMLPPDALRAAVLRSEVEVVITNPVHFIEIRAEHPLSGAVATMDMDPSEPSTPYFGGVIVRRRDRTEWASLEALSGARVAYQDRGLLGGYAAPLKRVLDAGVPRGSLRFQRIGSPYDGVLEAVLDGRADVGFVRTGVLERWRRLGKPRVEELEVVGAMEVPGFPHVTSTPLYPEWPVVVLPHLDEARSRRFTQALLSMEPDSEPLRAARIERVTIPANYARVEELMRDLRLPPFDSTVPVGWNDVWLTYRNALLGGVVLLLAGLAAGMALLRSRRRLFGILGAARAGTWEWNVQTGELRVNAHWAGMIGYRLAELEPITLDTWKSRVHPEDLDLVWQAVQAHLRGETPRYEVDLRMRHRLGHWVRMHDRGEVVARDGEGRPLWMSGLHLELPDHRPVPAADEPAP